MKHLVNGYSPFFACKGPSNSSVLHLKLKYLRSQAAHFCLMLNTYSDPDGAFCLYSAVNLSVFLHLFRKLMDMHQPEQCQNHGAFTIQSIAVVRHEEET